MKKGQITLFIIIGLVLLLTASFFILKSQEFSDEKSETERRETQDLSLSTTNFQDYVEGCMQLVVPKAVKSVAVKGGFNEWHAPYLYFSEEYNFICDVVLGDGCVNSIRSRSAISEELEYNISRSLERCLDISVFEEQGYEVTSQPVIDPVQVQIGIVDLSVIFNYNVRLERNNDIEQFTRFTQTYDYPLGKMIDLANFIINNELYQGHFNKDDWMAKHGMEVIITKHKPYPHILYELVTQNPAKMENFTYRFAIQGQDTVSSIASASVAQSHNTGCCKESPDLCYANTYASDCQGTWVPSQECLCEGITIFSDSLCDNQPCQDCASIPHNSSWCRTQGPAGYGNDYVGSRHYKISCLDGDTYIEEARDYREEICVHEPVPGTYRATIRPNRWETCAGSDNQADCEDITKHDCAWSGWLDWSKTSPVKESKCHPQVPPGLKFWTTTALSVCNMANNKRTCDGISCPLLFDEHMAIYCYKMGDCGNFRNINNIITKKGFYYLQEYSDPELRDYIYFDEDAIDKVYDLSIGTDYHPSLTRTGSEFNNPDNNIFELVDYAMDYYKTASSWDIPEDLFSCDPFFPFGCEMDKYVIDIGLCSLWQAPENDACQECEGDYEICSEYRCRSLGKGCVFETIDGVPTCYEADPNDSSPPSLMFDDSILNTGHTALDDSYYGYVGKMIDPGMVPFDTLQFGIITNEPTTCNINLLPSSYIELPISSNLYGINEFDTHHTIRIPMIPPEQIKDRLTDTLNLTTILELNNLIDQYQTVLLDYANDPDYSEYSSEIIDILDTIDENYDPAWVSFFTDGLIQMEMDNYRLFVYCKDRSGNVNTNPYLVSVAVDGTDTSPPHIVDVIPENDAHVYSFGKVDLRLFNNEPVECRYSLASKPFDEMEKEFDCYRFSARNDFSYECTAQIPVATGANRFYFICRDQPIRYQDLELNLIYSPTTGLVEPAASDAIEFTGSMANVSDLSILGPGTKIGTQTSIDLRLNFGSMKSCYYSKNKDDSISEMSAILCTPRTYGQFCQQTFIKDASLITKYYIRCHDYDVQPGNIGSQYEYRLSVN